MDYLHSLQSLSFDQLTVALTKYPSELKEKYKDYNIKVLLASFLMTQFKDELHIETPLFSHATTIKNKLLNNKEISLEEYNTYYMIFNNWKCKDIKLLKEDINKAITQLDDIWVNEDNCSEADVQWNEGMRKSLDLLRDSVKKLDSYSS